MFNISTKGIENIAEAIMAMDRQMAENLSELTEIIHKCIKLGLIDNLPGIKKAEETLAEKRCQVYEYGFTLEKIAKRYKRTEQYLLEVAEEGCVRQPRETVWVPISFSEADMSVIQKIKL